MEDKPKKRLIICCDGTWQASNHGLKTIPSNIAKLSRAISFYEKTADGKFIDQVVYYSAGVGTGTDSAKDLGFVQDQIAWLVKKWEGGVGAGLDENVCEAYNFIVNNYVPGDELYFFGFSRGAYTARATAGLVASVGLCTMPMLDVFYRMYDAYRLREQGQKLEDTAWGMSSDGAEWRSKSRQEVIIKVVGVFDTVGSLGYPDTGHVDVKNFNRRFGFHDTNLHPSIEYGFHALALDEHRRPFSPTLWSLPAPVEGKPQTKKLIQCWFPGMHVNIGGGNSDSLEEKKKNTTDMEAMANITYAWMIDRVREYTDLVFDQDAINDIVLRFADAQLEDLDADDKRKGARAYQGWGMGPVADSIDGMKAAGSLIRSPGHYPEKGETQEYIHPVVAYAKRDGAPKAYNSSALDGFKRTKRTDPSGPHGPGYDWIKDYDESQDSSWFSYLFGKSHRGHGKKTRVVIPEFKIPISEGTSTGTERWLMRSSSDSGNQGFAPEGSKEALLHAVRSDAFEQTDRFIAQLDQDNGVSPAPVAEEAAGFHQGGFQETKL